MFHLTRKATFGQCYDECVNIWLRLSRYVGIILKNGNAVQGGWMKPSIKAYFQGFQGDNCKMISNTSFRGINKLLTCHCPQLEQVQVEAPWSWRGGCPLRNSCPASHLAQNRPDCEP